MKAIGLEAVQEYLQFLEDFDDALLELDFDSANLAADAMVEFRKEWGDVDSWTISREAITPEFISVLLRMQDVSERVGFRMRILTVIDDINNSFEVLEEE